MNTLSLRWATVLLALALNTSACALTVSGVTLKTLKSYPDNKQASQPPHMMLPTEEHAKPNSQAATQSTHHMQATETIGILNLHLSNQTLNQLQRNIRQSFTQADQAPAANDIATTEKAEPSVLPLKVDLGMNGVPVLQQGAHGSCVTFSLSAAMDAILGRGDWISQLCALELWQTPTKMNYAKNGWDGSNLSVIARQFAVDGIVSKKNQYLGACAGVTRYNTRDPEDTGTSLHPHVYHTFSQSIADRIYVEPIQDERELLFVDPSHQQRMLQSIKQALAKGQRVLIAAALAVDYGDSGARGTYRARNDSFMLFPQLYHNPQLNLGYHEMIVYGYDDTVPVKEGGKTKYGILKLRNSWGPNVGDHGDYYMSYDYLKALVLGAARVVDASTLADDH